MEEKTLIEQELNDLFQEVKSSLDVKSGSLRSSLLVKFAETAQDLYDLDRTPEIVQTQFAKTTQGNFIYRHIIDGEKMPPRYYNVKQELDISCNHVEHAAMKDIFDYIGKSTKVFTQNSLYMGRELSWLFRPKGNLP